MSEDTPPYGNKNENNERNLPIFEVNAQELIDNSIDLRSKAIEIQKAGGELRITNRSVLYANNNKYAFLMREAIMMAAELNIFISVEGVEDNPKEDSSVSPKTAKTLIKDPNIVAKEIEKNLRKPGRSKN